MDNVKIGLLPFPAQLRLRELKETDPIAYKEAYICFLDVRSEMTEVYKIFLDTYNIIHNKRLNTRI